MFYYETPNLEVMKKSIRLICLCFFCLLSCASEETKNDKETENIENTYQSIEDYDLSIETISVKNINPYNAYSGCKLTSTKNTYHDYKIISKGICWSTHTSPNINQNTKIDTFTADNYLAEEIDNYYNFQFGKLNPNTTYFVRAFVKIQTNYNSNKEPIYVVFYGNELNFKTLNILDLKIGQNYGGGVIAYIAKKNDGLYIENEIHGILVSPTYPVNSNFPNSLRPVTYAGAVKYCKTLVLENYYDWSLPNMYNLQKLSTLFAMDVGYIKDTSYWSTTEHGGGVVGTAFRVYCVAFDLGRIPIAQSSPVDKLEYNNAKAIRFF